MKIIKTEIRIRPSRTENLFLDTAKVPNMRMEIKIKMEVLMNGVVLVIDNGSTIAAMPITRPEFVILVPIILPRASPGLRIKEACIASVTSGSEVPMAISKMPIIDSGRLNICARSIADSTTIPAE